MVFAIKKQSDKFCTRWLLFNAIRAYIVSHSTMHTHELIAAYNESTPDNFWWLCVYALHSTRNSTFLCLVFLRMNCFFYLLYTLSPYFNLLNFTFCILFVTRAHTHTQHRYLLQNRFNMLLFYFSILQQNEFVLVCHHRFHSHFFCYGIVSEEKRTFAKMMNVY